jgi:hypothetical protein
VRSQHCVDIRHSSSKLFWQWHPGCHHGHLSEARLPRGQFRFLEGPAPTAAPGWSIMVEAGTVGNSGSGGQARAANFRRCSGSVSRQPVRQVPSQGRCPRASPVWEWARGPTGQPWIKARAPAESCLPRPYRLAIPSLPESGGSQ